MPSQPDPWDIYNQALVPFKYGDGLWEPGPIYSYKRVRPGDVGYTRRGRFHLLFSAGVPLGSRVPGTDVPLTFEPLDVGPIIPGEVRPPGYLRTNTIRQIGVDVGGSVAVACPVEPGARMAFELTRKQGAALITQHPTYREDIERERTFSKYIKQHYESWVVFALERGDGDNIRPVLVTGVDLTREFAMVAYSDNHTRMECEFSAAVPGVASASVSAWGSWRAQGLVHTNCGPRPFPARRNRGPSEGPALESEIPDGCNQCVFIRYYTIRKRLFIPMVIKAGAGPHQLPKGNHDDNSAEEELQVLLADEPMEIDYPETGSPRDTFDKVVHNVPTDDRDNFDIVAEFIFQRSDAKSMLLHHRDIQDLLQGDEGESARLLAESGVAARVQIDEDGVGELVSSTATESSELTQPASDITDSVRDQVLPTEIGSASDPPPLESGTIATPGHSAGLHADDVARERLRFLGVHEFIPHPIRGMDAGVGPDGTVIRVFGPPIDHIVPDNTELRFLSQEDSRVAVPQHRYRGKTQKDWIPESTIYFFTLNRLGVKVSDMLERKFSEMNDRDDLPFGKDSRGITIRIHFLGYPSSTDVEKKLKKARSMQLSTKNYRDPPEPVTKSKLVQEVSKRIKWHITDLENNSNLFPFNDQVDQQWRLGEGRMTLEHMLITGLVNVSSGSWSPIIHIE